MSNFQYVAKLVMKLSQYFCKFLFSAEIFPGFRLGGDAAFFAAACDDLTEEQKTAAKMEFTNRLTENGVCMKGLTKICNIEEAGIICGRTIRRRRRRGVDYTEQSVDFAFNVTALNFDLTTAQCDREICPMLRIPERYCEKYCKPQYKRFLKASVLYAWQQLTNLFTNQTKMQDLVIHVQNVTFDPQSNGFSSADVKGSCPEGMAVVDELCSKFTLHIVLGNSNYLAH